MENKEKMSNIGILIVVIIGILLLVLAGMIVFYMFNKKDNGSKFDNDIVGIWDYYNIEDNNENYGEISFKISEDGTFEYIYQFGEDPEEDVTFKAEKYDNKILIKGKKNDDDHYSYMNYIFIVDGDRLCISEEKCTDNPTYILKKRVGDNAPSTTTTETTTTKVITTTAKQIIDNNKPTLYVFYGEGCPHCEELFNYLDNNALYNKVNIVKYEVWNNEENKKFADKVAAKLNTTVGGVPFYVIGDEYFSGYSSDSNGIIEQAVNNYLNNKASYKDIVATVK